MIAMMPWLGLSLLLLVGLGIAFTGLPAAVVLLAAACFGAAMGALGGDVPIQLIGVLPERLINLLDNDLLQAIPLYVLMGTLINRLPLAEALYRCCLAVLPGPAAPAVSGVVLGGLLGPMNGSVGASVLALGRVVEPRLAAAGLALPRRAAIIAVASTPGVVVPPSLVLILLRDAHSGELVIQALRQRKPGQGKVLGVVVFIAAESGRRYDAGDLTVAEDLAHRAVVAIKNARLYDELREDDRRQDEYLATLAPELRNPLDPIRHSLQ